MRHRGRTLTRSWSNSITLVIAILVGILALGFIARTASAQGNNPIAGKDEDQLPGQIFLDSVPGSDPLGGVVALDPNAGTWRKVTEKRCEHPCVSLDGRTLAVSVGFFGEPDAKLWLYDTRGQEKVIKVISAERGDPITWSRDGKSLLLWKREFMAEEVEIWLVAIDGSRKERLPIPATEYVSDWSPDGRWFVSRSKRGETEPLSLRLFRPDGTGERVLLPSTSNVPAFGGRLGIWPRFTADSRIVLIDHFGKDDEENATAGIMLLDTVAGKHRRIHNQKTQRPNESIWPTGSPDGKFIAAIKGEDEPEAQLLRKSYIEIVDMEGRIKRTIPLPLPAERRAIVAWR